MTRYVYDEARRAIARLEPQVPDPLVQDVCVLASVDDVDGSELAILLTRLAASLWQLHDRAGGVGELERDRLARVREALDVAFADLSARSDAQAAQASGSRAGEPDDPESDALQALERGAFDEVPHVSGIHLRGWLRQLEDLVAVVPASRDALVGEVGRQAAAVQRARLGDYSGEAVVGAWRERGFVEPLLLASALETVASQVEGGWYATGQRTRQLIEQVGVEAAAAALSELVHVAVHATAGALGYDNVNDVLLDADAYEAIDLHLIGHLAAATSGAIAAEQLLVDAAHLRRGELTPEILLRVDSQSEHARNLAASLAPEDAETSDALLAEGLTAVPLAPASAASDLVQESLDGLAALLALFSSDEYETTVEMLEDEGMTEPEPDDDEAMESWDAEVQARTTASWLTILSLSWENRH